MINWEKIKNNELLFVLGIIMILPIFSLKGIIDRFEIFNKGEYVSAVITDKTGSLRSHWIDFKYQDKFYYRQVGSAYYNEFEIGDTIRLKKYGDIKYFLFETERPMARLILTLIPFFVGILLLVFIWFKK
jgi:hypothetical protein